MADVIKKATREAYGASLAELGAVNEKVIVLDADLAEATKTGMFKKAFPERFFDTGIAECNMMGVAGGLATTGYTVFASSFREETQATARTTGGIASRSGKQLTGDVPRGWKSKQKLRIRENAEFLLDSRFSLKSCVRAAEARPCARPRDGWWHHRNWA